MEELEHFEDPLQLDLRFQQTALRPKVQCGLDFLGRVHRKRHEKTLGSNKKFVPSIFQIPFVSKPLTTSLGLFDH